MVFCSSRRGTIGTQQLRALRSLRGTDGGFISSNIKSVQSLNGRTIVGSVGTFEAAVWSFANIEDWHYSYTHCGDGLDI